MMASMGPGLPFAIAAKLAYPARQSVAVVGDGGFAMLMAEVTTAIAYDLPVKIVILKNNSLAEVKFEQIALGNPALWLRPCAHRFRRLRARLRRGGLPLRAAGGSAPRDCSRASIAQGGDR